MNGDSRSRLLFERAATTTLLRHRPLIDPMVLIILIPPILLLLFLFLLTYVPKPIKPTSFKSTFYLFIIFLLLLASLFHILNHEENEFSTNMVVEHDQHQDVNGVNEESDENSFFDSVYSPFWDEPMDVAGNNDDQRTSTPPTRPEPWMHVNYQPGLPPLPPSRPRHQPEPQNNDQSSSSSRASHSSWSAPPRAQSTLAPQPQPEPRHYDRQSSMSSRSESSYIPEPPPPPPFNMPQMRYEYFGDYVRIRSLDSNASTSRNSQASRTPPPARPQPEPESRHYDQQSSLSSSSQSSYIPEPPPPPPFDISANRYIYIGDYARLRSLNSNTSSSPDLHPMAGQPSTSMDSGDSFWSSPDVNAKAGIFISKVKDKWKKEYEDTIEKKGGASYINKLRKQILIQ